MSVKSKQASVEFKRPSQLLWITDVGKVQANRACPTLPFAELVLALRLKQYVGGLPEQLLDLYPSPKSRALLYGELVERRREFDEKNPLIGTFPSWQVG